MKSPRDIPLRQLDLFSGAGMFSLAGRWAGIETVAFSEINEYASRVLEKRFPGVRNLGDVRKLCRRAYDCEPENEDGECICPRCSTDRDPVDFGDCKCIGTDEFTDNYGFPEIITAGSPCQGFSFAGEGRGLEDPRSGLVYEVTRIARELNPYFLLIENVPGFKDRGSDEIRSELALAGYASELFSLGTNHVGGHQRRERLWLVAYDKSVGMEGMRPEGFQEPYALAEPFLPLRRSDGQWEVEPDVRRVPDGDAHRVDRLELIGNSLSPQIPVMFLDFMQQIIRQNFKKKS